MNVELKDGVWCVGVVDWGLRHFHGHELSTHRGSSYNAYLIMDEKVALIDTVWSPFREKLMENIREIIDPAKIDIVVANHAEVDHSGGLPEVMRQATGATLVVSKRGAESVPGHYHQQWNFKPVQTGERISLGKNELVFIEAPKLHWPDSMFTYLTGHNILMSNDAFGQHYASAFRFNDQVNQAELYEEALKYFVNILTPFSDRVLKKIDEIVALNLPVDIIAPSHGIIWRSDPMQIVGKYQEWASQKPEPAAVIIYDTMWHATRRMAEAIGDGLSEAGVDPKDITVARSADMRLFGQMHEIKVPLPSAPLDEINVADLTGAFAEVYTRLYTHLYEGSRIQALHWRVLCSGPTPKVDRTRQAGTDASGRDRKSSRLAYFPEAGDFVDV
ncbi:MAG: MBL fold metallo-hydrolase, partial [Phycisphaerae bacterium]|nr:MBL fold metallo-hydrolase [Phycisphaerae bacterium]